LCCLSFIDLWILINTLVTSNLFIRSHQSFLYQSQTSPTKLNKIISSGTTKEVANWLNMYEDIMHVLYIQFCINMNKMGEKEKYITRLEQFHNQISKFVERGKFDTTNTQIHYHYIVKYPGEGLLYSKYSEGECLLYSKHSGGWFAMRKVYYTTPALQ
jgi:hypothetical protein